jgi:Tfp pilus assembly protein FimT
MGLLALMMYPRLSSAVVRTDLRGARTRIVNMLAAARTAATQGNRNARLVFNGNQVLVTADGRRKPGNGTIDTVGSVVNLTTTYKASVSTGGVTQIAFDPRGFAVGLGNGVTTIQLTRGSYSSSVAIDKLGRVTK